jgi:hypothetical protein
MPLRRGFRVAGMVWRWYANAAGFTAIALALAFFIVQVATGNGAVVTADDVRLLVNKTKPEGSISYVYNLIRHEACPGEVMQLWTMGHGRDAIVIQTQRPAVYTEVRYYDDLRVTVALPPSIVPGKWRYHSTLESTCPNRRQSDLIADFEFEVTQP